MECGRGNAEVGRGERKKMRRWEDEKVFRIRKSECGSGNYECGIRNAECGKKVKGSCGRRENSRRGHLKLRLNSKFGIYIRSVWMIRKGDTLARLITLIPEKKL